MDRSIAVADRALALHWITGPRYDLLLYIAPALVSYALLYLHLGLGVPALLIYWAWTLSLDGPHVFGTLSRTYFDREEWRTRGRLLLLSLLWFLPGPLLVAGGVACDSRLPYLWFLIFANLWAYWHVVRQHYGFLALYQRKNGETAGRENRIDYWFFYLVMLAPFVCFVLYNPEARMALGLGPVRGSFEELLIVVAKGATWSALAVYAAKELRRWWAGQPLNAPKNLFLAACVPLHMVVCTMESVAAHIPILLFTVLVTQYHNFQYTGIVWYYNRNRYGGDGDGRRFGWASLLSRNFVTYYAAGVLFTVLLRYGNWGLNGMEVPGGPGPNAVSATAIGAGLTIADLAIATWWGIAFHHYYLDQRIWRVSKDQRLKSDLKVA